MTKMENNLIKFQQSLHQDSCCCAWLYKHSLLINLSIAILLANLFSETELFKVRVL